MDADPVNAPAPTDPRDPRTATPYPLPHNSGELWTGALKLVAPVTERATVRALRPPLGGAAAALRSGLQVRRPVLAGAAASGRSGERPPPVRQRSAQPSDRRSICGSARFVREFLRGEAGGGGGLRLRGLHRLDGSTSSARIWPGRRSSSPDPIPGFGTPGRQRPDTRGACRLSSSADGSRGDLAWNRFGETRVQLDVHPRRAAAGWTSSSAASSPRSRSAPGSAPSASSRSARRCPTGPRCRRWRSRSSRRGSVAGYAEAQIRVEDIAITGGLRYDQFDAGSDLATESRGAQRSLSPRFAISTVLERRDLRRQLRPLQPGAGLPVPGGCRIRRHHAHRPLPPGQPGHRLRGGAPSTSSACGRGRGSRSRCGWASTSSGSPAWLPRCRWASTPTARSSGTPTPAA